MSADNGIYILETEGPEYRVRELAAVDNVYWDTEIEGENGYGAESDDPDVWIKNAREMWTDCNVYSHKEDALSYAAILEKDYPYLEYGISFIRIPRRF